jgi:hypothetical protein
MGSRAPARAFSGQRAIGSRGFSASRAGAGAVFQRAQQRPPLNSPEGVERVERVERVESRFLMGNDTPSVPHFPPISTAESPPQYRRITPRVPPFHPLSTACAGWRGFPRADTPSVPQGNAEPNAVRDVHARRGREVPLCQCGTEGVSGFPWPLRDRLNPGDRCALGSSLRCPLPGCCGSVSSGGGSDKAKE